MMSSIQLFIWLCFFSLLSHSETKLTLESESLHFISSDFEAHSKNHFVFLGGTVRSDKFLKQESQKTDFIVLDLTGHYSAGASGMSYLNIREIYFKLQTDEQSNLFIGRKKMDWSNLDDQWNLGFINPEFRWNKLQPEVQGLTGLFWQQKQTDWVLNLFASPLFIPDQGASYEIKDGQFQDVNPWFINPPQNIKFQGQVLLPVDYQIEKPETSEVVFQTSYGAQLKVGQDKGYYSKFSGMYKPSNQFALGYKVVGVVDRVRVDLKPKIYYENDYAIDLGYRSEIFQTEFSMIYTKPKDATFDSGYNYPEFSDSTSYGAHFKLDLKPFWFGLGALATQGAEVKDVGPDSSADRKSLSSRFLFREAYQLEAGYSEIYMKQYRYMAEIQYRESQSDQFKQVHFFNRLKSRGTWAIWADLLLIETTSDSTQSQSESSSLEPYRNLDQFIFGVSYDI